MLALRADLRISDAPLFTDVGSSVELSPDGTRLVYVSGTTQTQQMYVRPLNQLDAAKLAEGNTGATSPYQPFFSPDGQWLGYVTAAELRKVPVSGGTPLTLTKVTRSRGASWSEDGTIIFAPNPASGLFRVSAAGGDAQPVTTLDKAKKEATHRWPQVLPGGKAVIFTSHTQTTADFDNATIEVLTLATGERKVLQKGGSYGRYVPTGHLVYVSKAALFAVPFDLDGWKSPDRRRRWFRTSSGTPRKARRITFSSTGVLTTCAAGPRWPNTGLSRWTAEGARPS